MIALMPGPAKGGTYTICPDSGRMLPDETAVPVSTVPAAAVPAVEEPPVDEPPAEEPPAAEPPAPDGFDGLLDNEGGRY